MDMMKNFYLRVKGPIWRQSKGINYEMCVYSDI